jgi:hypothetical protein
MGHLTASHNPGFKQARCCTFSYVSSFANSSQDNTCQFWLRSVRWSGGKHLFETQLIPDGEYRCHIASRIRGLARGHRRACSQLPAMKIVCIGAGYVGGAYARNPCPLLPCRFRNLLSSLPMPEYAR